MSTTMTISRRFPIRRKDLKPHVAIGDNCKIICFQEMHSVKMDGYMNDFCLDWLGWNGENSLSACVNDDFINALLEEVSDEHGNDGKDQAPFLAFLKKESAIISNIQGETLFQIDIG